jgi:hypothetical protein
MDPLKSLKTLEKLNQLTRLTENRYLKLASIQLRESLG